MKKVLGMCVDGLPFAAISVALAFVAFRMGGLWAFIPFALISVWVFWFFRDPERTLPNDEKAIISPADGTVIDVRRVAYPRLLRGEATRVSVFMSVFNVHVNRIPYEGTVRETSYNAGKFLAAWDDKASLDNEQMAVVVDTAKGPILFVQIAGLIARRIVCRLKVGETMKTGERFGLIRFGSRCDIYFPDTAEVTVKSGEKVFGGKTILGRWK